MTYYRLEKFIMLLRNSICSAVLLSTPYTFAGTPCSEQKDRFPEINQVYQSGDFRFFYSDQPKSKHFIPDQTDANKNKIPDYIENMAIQANTTAAALKQLGFKAPLETERYKNNAKTIDFVVQAMKSNGVAYENPISTQSENKQQQQCGLKINIRYNVEDFPGTWSIVTHELFHLYQYGYSQFKNPWYLEGMTNWLERVIRKENGEKYLTPLPSSKEELDKNVFKVPYNDLWHRLGYLATEDKGKLQLPSDLMSTQYTNGEPVFKDDIFNGWLFNLNVLKKLEASSLELSKQNNLDPYNWEEALQRSPENNKYILKAIQETMREMQIVETPEQQAFLEISVK